MSAHLSSVGQLVSLIRTQLISSNTPLPSSKQRPQANTKNADSNGQNNLEFVIGQRIKAIDRDDPQRGKKAFRVFLESILLSHFGDHLINDPKFYQLIDEVQTSMENNPEANGMIQLAIEHLLSDAA
ncbi:hypothetical protein ACO0LO_10595 [Undibacterium sp. TJN25]|uniref:hypothetical protein n=1 Tax=Undibacterium sp. TJN25 TaxID=3413056 RepID=UPI003BEFE98B